MDLDFSRALIVREAMSSPVITVWENDSVADAAGVMKENRIGAIIVHGGESQPVGIITERDLVYRVIAEGGAPSEIRVKEVMSSPLMTVDPEASLEEAMAMMNMNNISRLKMSETAKQPAMMKRRFRSCGGVSSAGSVALSVGSAWMIFVSTFKSSRASVAVW